MTLQDRRSSLLTDHIEVIKNAMSQVNRAMPYQTVAIVILPEHLHTLWTLPKNDHRYDTRWRRIKSIFIWIFSKYL